MKGHLITAEYVSGYIIRLTFRDGTTGEIDLTAELTGPMFEPLRTPEVFRQFSVYPEFHTLVHRPVSYLYYYVSSSSGVFSVWADGRLGTVGLLQ